MTMSENLIFSIEKHVGLITLNRPAALNALTHPMILALHEQLQAWETDTIIHAIVIQAADGRAFCAGGDVRAVYEAGHHNPLAALSFFRDEYRLNHFIHNLKKPYIALMDGLTLGGGVGISLHGSHPVASDRFAFAMPETSIGFFPDIGSSHLLSRYPNGSGQYLGLTGHRLNPLEARALGLIHSVIPAHAMPLLLASLINANLTQNAHAAVDACLRPYQQPHTTTPGLVHAEEIATCFSQPSVLSILQSLDNLGNDWARETQLTLLQKAPMSLHVTLEQLQRAKGMNLAECLQMDYGLTYHFMQKPDFYEGVRALLIDKDKSPRWTPASLDAVDLNEVATYFVAPLDDALPLW